MGKKLYVGNLSYGVTDSQLEQLFAAHGAVQSAQVIMDRETGRALTVNEARPKTEGSGGGRGGYGGGGGGRRY